MWNWPQKWPLPGLEGQNDFWVSLTNPDSITCSDSDCSNKLQWLDGSNFTWDPQLHSSIDANQTIYGLGFNVDQKRFFKSDSDKPYACMSLCVRKSQITKDMSRGYFQSISVCQEAPPVLNNTFNDFMHAEDYYVGAIVRWGLLMS